MSSERLTPEPTPTRADGSAFSDEDLEDFTCMRAVAAGDASAFEQLVRRHERRVFATLHRLVPGEAEDLAQQVFLRVWKSAARYKPSARFSTWLFQITKNVAFNELRRRKSRPSMPLAAQIWSEEPAETPEARLEDASTPGPSEDLLHAELSHAVDHAIAALPEQQRLALVLRRFEELPYEEIAAVLETTVPAVKSLLFRARSELKTRLTSYLRADR